MITLFDVLNHARVRAYKSHATKLHAWWRLRSVLRFTAILTFTQMKVKVKKISGRCYFSRFLTLWCLGSHYYSQWLFRLGLIRFKVSSAKTNNFWSFVLRRYQLYLSMVLWSTPPVSAGILHTPGRPRFHSVPEVLPLWLVLLPGLRFV